MKKLSVILSVLILATLILSACGGAPEAAPEEAPAAEEPAAEEPDAEEADVLDLGGATVVVAVGNAYPPFNMIDEDSGEAIGWDYDTVTAICEILNCVPEFKEAAWDGIFPAMQAGEYDWLANGVTYTEERDEILDFSIPYVTIVGQVLLTRADEANGLEEFKGNADLIVGTQIGTTNEIVARGTFPDKEIQSFEEFPAAALALLAGDIDGVVVDNITAASFVEEEEGLKIASQITSDLQLAFVFPPDSELVSSVNAALETMMADGSLDEINAKWGLSE